MAFLRALARYLSTSRLYEPDHSRRRTVVEEVAVAAHALLAQVPVASFSFLSDRVVFNDRPLRTLDRWPWAAELAGSGVQGLQIQDGLKRPELEDCLRVLTRQVTEREPSDDGNAQAWPHIRFGDLELDTWTPESEPRGSVRMDEEAQAVGHLHETAERKGRIAGEEAMVVVRSLAAALRGGQQMIVPFVRMKETDQYTAAHCLNVSVLAMALADAMDLPEAEVRAIGMAGLLHDVGKVAVPDEVLMSSDKLDEEEWAEMRRHPEHGGRILLDSGPGFQLPAVVAYEHHLSWDGSEGGYPEVDDGRSPLPQTRLVQVCDFYDALRTRRRYRKPMAASVVLDIMQRKAGDELDPQFVHPFVSLLKRWDPSTVMIEIRPEEESDAASELT